jgi:nitrite reductase (NO-forming)
MQVPYNAVLPPLTDEPVKQVVLNATDDIVVPLTKEVTYAGWGFNGSIPGPPIRVRQGDMIEATLNNKGVQGHSIDFHAAQAPWERDFKTILPNQSLTFRWQANFPGCFMYHCGTPPVLHHIANGMYGAIIVEPKDGWPTPADKTFALVQSEFYVTGGKGDGKKMEAVQPDFVAFNGVPNQYVDHPLTSDPGERVRLYVVNAGPTVFSGFHIVGAVFEMVYPDGNPQNRLVGLQTYTIPPGGGAVFDVVVPEAGLYPIVTHAFAYASKGAVGMLKVGQPAGAGSGGH